MSKSLSFHVPAENSTKVHCKKLRISMSFITYSCSNNPHLLPIKFWSGHLFRFWRTCLPVLPPPELGLLLLKFLFLFLPHYSLPTHQGQDVLKSPPTFAACLLLWIDLALSNCIMPLNTWLYFVTNILYFKMARLDYNWAQEVLHSRCLKMQPDWYINWMGGNLESGSRSENTTKPLLLNIQIHRLAQYLPW